MTEVAFNEQMNRLTGAFGKNNFTAERLEIIWTGVCDLPELSFRRICNHFISTMRQAPLPKDFLDAAYQERKRIDQLPPEAQEKYEHKIECQMCLDTGVNWLKPRFPEMEEIFCRCTCAEGIANTWRFPKYDHTMAQFWERKQLPWQWFKPDWPRKIGEKGYEHKVDWWKNKMKSAEQFWQTKVKGL